MNVLQIKGEILDLVSKVNDETIAEKLLKIVKSYINENVGIGEADTDDIEESMTPEEEAAIKRAVERSYDRSNYISSEEAKNRLAKWLKP